MVDTIVGFAFVGSAVIFLLVAGLIRAAGRARPKNAAPAPAQPTQPVPVRALTPDQFCMNYPCNNAWTNNLHGWKTCDVHNTPTVPACRICHRGDATEPGRMCAECRVRIRDHFDEFVDQALAIGNGEPDPADEAGQADLALWEIENRWTVS